MHLKDMHPVDQLAIWTIAGRFMDREPLHDDVTWALGMAYLVWRAVPDRLRWMDREITDHNDRGKLLLIVSIDDEGSIYFLDPPGPS